MLHKLVMKNITFGMPQIVVGKGSDSGNGATNVFCHENISGDVASRFHFSATSFLNVVVTAPYSHVCAYQTLNKVLDHYDDPRGEVTGFSAL